MLMHPVCGCVSMRRLKWTLENLLQYCFKQLVHSQWWIMEEGGGKGEIDLEGGGGRGKGGEDRSEGGRGRGSIWRGEGDRDKNGHVQ